jgi:uncharacterized protein (DUF3820 family)
MRKSFGNNMITDSRRVSHWWETEKVHWLHFPTFPSFPVILMGGMCFGRVKMDSDPWDNAGFTATVPRNGTAAQGPTPEPPPTAPEGMPPEKGCAPASTPMPWGKHKGTPIGQIPRSYMAWCLENADALKPELRRSFEWMAGVPVGSTKAKVDPNAKPWVASPGRSSRPAPEQPRVSPPPAAQIASLRGLVKIWYRKMSLRYHPDRGGSADSQKILNTCYQSLCEEVDRWEKQ